MYKESLPIVIVNILDKEYRVTCPDSDRDNLFKAARLLDEQMRSIRSSGKVIGTDRIAVMAALNFSYELLQNRSEIDEYNKIINNGIDQIHNKITLALSNLN